MQFSGPRRHPEPRLQPLFICPATTSPSSHQCHQCHHHRRPEEHWACSSLLSATYPQRQMDDLARKRRELIMRGACLVSVMCVYMTFFILRRARQNTPGKDSSSRSCGKRKRSSFLSEGDALLISNMCDAVRELASAIKSTVHDEAHSGVHKAVMDLSSFPVDSRFAVLEHLMEKKAMSLAFLQMDEEVRARWVTLFLAKHPAA